MHYYGNSDELGNWNVQVVTEIRNKHRSRTSTSHIQLSRVSSPRNVEVAPLWWVVVGRGESRCGESRCGVHSCGEQWVKCAILTNDGGGDGGGVVFIVSLFCMEYLLKIVSICICLSLVFDFP